MTEDALVRTLGPEQLGCVRGRGFGVTLKTLDALGPYVGWRKKMENELQQLKEWKREIEDTPASSSIPNKNIEDKHMPNVPKNNTKCRLLHWVGTKEFVAIGEVASTDPHALVHHVPLGPNHYKVWVIEILRPNIPLFQHSNEFSNLDDARGVQ